MLLASYYFYMCWKVEYIFLIIASTLIDYFCSLAMGRYTNQKKRLPYLILSLIVNLGLLFTFKYANFAFETLNHAFTAFNISYKFPHSKLLLPVGISFYTFQTLSYSIEVFQGKIKPEKHLGYFALYVAFFPQLVAGPIERYTRLAPQFRLKQILSYNNFAAGFRLVLYGLFIKMVIADNLAVYVDQVYENPSGFNTISIVTALIFYSFQIYSDFYGYSLVAIGSAKFLGIDIMDNFLTPYFSRNITEFWQRWHISLSTWFRDYLYLPLGGNKVKKGRWMLNIMLVFTISGLWHGANWTFLFWGVFFGICYLSERIVPRIRPIRISDTFKIYHVVYVLLTFLLTTFAWIFFRSENFSKVKIVFHSVVSNFHLADTFKVPNYVWIFLAFFLISDVVQYNSRFDKWIQNRHIIIRWSVYLILFWGIIAYTGLKDIPFIYFQF